MVGVVIRFNYIADVRARRRTPRIDAIAIDNRVRGPLAALAATVALTAAVSVVQVDRFHAARTSYIRAEERAAALRPQLDALSALRAHLATGRQLRDALDAMRRASLARVDDVAWIGNRLPAQTWLHTLRYDNGGYWLEGSSTQAAAVGASLLALADAQHQTAPELVSLHDDPAARVSYRLHLHAPR